MSAFRFPLLVLGATLLCASHPRVTQAQDSLVVASMSRHLWRGYDSGSGLSTTAFADVGLLGHARSTLGRVGVRGQFAALVPVSRRTASRRAGEAYLGALSAYVCLDGTDCAWALSAGVEEQHRPHPRRGPNWSPEAVFSLRGVHIFQGPGIRLVPVATLRRDLNAFDGWMLETGVDNLMGRGSLKASVSLLARFSDYAAWGGPTDDDFLFHSLDAALGFQKASVLKDSFLVSWSWWIEARASLAEEDIGPKTVLLRMGLTLIR